MIFSLSSCIHIKSSYVKVTVYNSDNQTVGSGTTVYMMPSGPGDSFGDNPMFADLTMTTNADGVAEFLLKPNHFAEQAYGEITKHFTVFTENDDFFDKYVVSGTISTNVKYGETVEVSITLGENANTFVTIYVENQSGNPVSGMNVYMFEDAGFSDNPMFADKQMTTDQEGKAEFILDSSDFSGSSNQIITRYFKVLEEMSGAYIERGSVSANIEYGANEEYTMVIN